MEEDDLVIIADFATNSIVENGDMPYHYYSFYGNNYPFKLGNGIDQNMDNHESGNFYPYYSNLNIHDKGYVCLYFDNEAVDLFVYEKNIGNFREQITSDNFNLSSVYFGCNINLFDPTFLDTNFSDHVNIYQTELTLTNALFDGRKKIENHDISKMYLFWYSLDDNVVDVFVYGDEMIDLKNDPYKQ